MKLLRNCNVTILLISIALGALCFATELPRKTNSPMTSSISFGSKTQQPLNVQTKRDLSLSYSATDIDSKEGARVKTITVIKNLNKDGKSEKIAINPALHKNENWADAFRDNFDSFGAIPDVPDIDDLFDFVNKKDNQKPKEKPEMKNEKQPTTPHKMNTQQHKTDVEKPVVESTTMEALKTSEKNMNTQKTELSTKPMAMAMAMTVETVTIKANVERSAPTVEKISGDAELVSHASKRQSTQNGNSNEASVIRSQSLSLSKEDLREQLVNVNYSTPQHSVHQYFEKYVQQSVPVPVSGGGAVAGYDYPRPCHNIPTSSVNVNTPSGRTYDIPPSRNNAGNNIINPYIAPSVSKKPQTQPQPIPPQSNTQQGFLTYNPNQAQIPAFSVNSVVPPLQSTTAGNVAIIGPTRPTLSNQQPQTTINQQPVQQPQSLGGNTVGVSTSQRPYLAPSLRNGLGLSRGPPPTPIYGTGSPNFRVNSYNVGTNTPNVFRSRGLKY